MTVNFRLELNASNTYEQCRAESPAVFLSQRVLLYKATMGGQWINDVATRSTALSCQQKLMADLQLALNHCLTTTFASATSTATDINLRLWPGCQLNIRLRRCEAYQSINLSLTTSLTSSCHCRNKMICGPVGCCLLSQSVYSLLWVQDFFFTERFMWLSACHHVIAAFLPAVLFSNGSSCLR